MLSAGEQELCFTAFQLQGSGWKGSLYPGSAILIEKERGMTGPHCSPSFASDVLSIASTDLLLTIEGIWSNMLPVAWGDGKEKPKIKEGGACNWKLHYRMLHHSNSHTTEDKLKSIWLAQSLKFLQHWDSKISLDKHTKLHVPYDSVEHIHQ